MLTKAKKMFEELNTITKQSKLPDSQIRKVEAKQERSDDFMYALTQQKVIVQKFLRKHFVAWRQLANLPESHPDYYKAELEAKEDRSDDFIYAMTQQKVIVQKFLRKHFRAWRQLVKE